MSKHLARITLGTVLIGLFLGGMAQAEEKIKVLIVDGQNNHNWIDTTPFLKKVLLDSGRFTADIATTPPHPSSALGKVRYKDNPGGYMEDMASFRPEFSKYDVVLSNYNGDNWPEEARKGLEKFVAGGKGLVIVHAANNAFSGWPEYNLMIGMGWRDNKFGDRLTLDESGKERRVPKGEGPGAGHGSQHAFPVVIRDTEHPVTKGMPREWLHAPDELYHGMRGPVANVRLLATALADKKRGGGGSSGEHEPMIWTVTYGQGRVFHTPMGHVMGKDMRAMHCVGFITTLLRGTEWAATEKVTLPIPDNFPTATETKAIGTP